MKTLVVAELLDGKLRKNTLSALRFALDLKEKAQAPFDILSIGQGASSAADELKGFGAETVWSTEIEGGYLAEHYAPTIAELVQQKQYNVIVATATSFGKDLLPRAAARLDAGMASDITSMNYDGQNLSFVRPMYAGNVFATVQISTPIQVVTVRQSEFGAAEEQGSQSPIAPFAKITAGPTDKIEFLELKSVKSERPELTDAKVVVSGGRALKSADNFKTSLNHLLMNLSRHGASRAACDAGYVSGDLQIGQTGKVVAPNLYIAVGISGAIQHLAGMKGSKVIVAINKDKEAPIAQVADYFWAADLLMLCPRSRKR
ncbi:MAG: electron transfer flavoprotein subunit alpha/FixB family protein [Myxococcales bacterium]|nr:MAG: electron transfer flavoprotein subunit alpha/FixB family protein [Myxococcales bacterium]